MIAFVVVSRLRRSGIGRTTIAVRDNADRAAAYTVGVASSKLRAFAIAGFIAGFGGALLAGAIESVPFTERYFLVADSLALVALVVIGGIGVAHGRRARLAVGRRAPRLLPRQQPGAAVHLEPRAA